MTDEETDDKNRYDAEKALDKLSYHHRLEMIHLHVCVVEFLLLF